MKLTVYLGIALALSLLVNIGLGWRLAGAKPRCEAVQAKATVHADQGVRADETKRDTKLDAVSSDTKADAHKAVAATERDTHERAQAIDRIAVHGGCAAPVGLPPLDAAVDQANAAAGH